MSAPTAVYRDQKWIISPAADSIFFVGTPLLCLVPLMALRQVFDSQVILFFIMSFFAMGHHLPGFMRAYGDPELFQTFKEKFLVAPIVVLFVVALAQFNTLHGLFLMVLVWEIWHLFMQHYGIMRIYDGKNKIFAKWNARWDWLLTMSAFITVVVYSPEYFYRILDHNQSVGLPFLSADHLLLIKDLLLYATMGIAVGYIGNLGWRLVTKQKVSFPKIAVMATTIFLIYFGWIYIQDLTIGYAAFAAFHDIQYFAIVWVYNNNLVKRQSNTSRLLRAFFTSRSLPILVGYVLICFIYGSVNYSLNWFDRASWIKAIEVLVITSTLLHYYFDGFIWKMRDKRNQVNLEIEGETGWDKIGARATVEGLITRLRSYFGEAGRQLLYFALPVLALSAVPFYWHADEAEARGIMVELFPDLPGAHNDQGVFYSRLGDWDRASVAYQRAIELDPDSHEALKNMGVVYARHGQLEEAHEYYQRALKVKPKFVEALNAQGLILMQRGDFELAQERFIRAVGEFDYAPAYNNLGTAYLRQEVYGEAISAYTKAVELDGTDAAHHYNLGLAMQKANQNEGSIRSFEQAIGLAPRYTKAYLSLALSHQRSGDLPQARQALQRLLRVEPQNATASQLLQRMSQ
ncbi:MAG: tetratricopeptide (TPR) repeat protein [Candidatus Latescibacterota bacterium]|jgi:tetratricopeptide (TPR) repeat protein